MHKLLCADLTEQHDKSFNHFSIPHIQFSFTNKNYKNYKNIELKKKNNTKISQHKVENESLRAIDPSHKNTFTDLQCVIVYPYTYRVPYNECNDLLNRLSTFYTVTPSPCKRFYFYFF